MAASTRHRRARPAAIASLLAATVLAACTANPTSPPPATTAVTSDCGAIQLLRASSQQIQQLRDAVAAGSASRIQEAADAVLKPAETVLSAYNPARPAATGASAIGIAAFDLVDSAGLLQRLALTSTSAPPSGLGSRSWALAELTRAAAEVDAAAKGVSGCP